MNKDEMKNRISIGLKDPILQQGFEIICKNLAELEEENARLKEKLKPENCLKLLAKGGYIKFTSDQLTKAKEIIKELLDTQSQLDPYRNVFKERILKAEQFLREVEK